MNKDYETSPGLERLTQADQLAQIKMVAHLIVQSNMVQSTLYHLQMTLYGRVHAQFHHIPKDVLNEVIKQELAASIEEQASDIINFVTAGDAHDF